MRVNSLKVTFAISCFFMTAAHGQNLDELKKLGSFLNKLNQPQKGQQPATTSGNPVPPEVNAQRQATLPSSSDASALSQQGNSVDQEGRSSSQAVTGNSEPQSDRSFVERRKFPPEYRGLNWTIFTQKNLSLYYIPDTLGGNQLSRTITIRRDEITPNWGKTHSIFQMIVNCSEKKLGIKVSRQYRGHEPEGNISLKPIDVAYDEVEAASLTPISFQSVTADPDYPEILARACQVASFPKSANYWDFERSTDPTIGKISEKADFRGLTIGAHISRIEKAPAFTNSGYQIKSCYRDDLAQVKPTAKADSKKYYFKNYVYGDTSYVCAGYPFYGAKGTLVIYFIGDKVSAVSFSGLPDVKANNFIPALVTELVESKFKVKPALKEDFDGLTDSVAAVGGRIIQFQWTDGDGDVYQVRTGIDRRVNTSPPFQLSGPFVQVLPKDFDSARFSRLERIKELEDIADKDRLAKEGEAKKKGGF